MNKAIGHLKTVTTHKTNVAKYCFMCGLYKQGILHDMSKFSPAEFIESVKYWTGTYSPIDACKKANGYSLAWLHHKGRNRHHWEYWVDDFDRGINSKKMPYKYMLEMVCDYLGAGRAYSGKDFTMESEWKWWQNKRKIVLMHHDTFRAIDYLMNEMYEKGIENVLKNKDFMKKFKEEYEGH